MIFIIYLDNAATTKPADQVIKDITKCLTNNWCNPSSPYQEGIESRKIIENARKQIADYINAEPEEIIFTSGGSESNNLAIKGFTDQYHIETVITTQFEHPSVYRTCLYDTGGTFIPVQEDGLINLNYLETVLNKCNIDSYKLISIMYVNNEIGTIQPIKEISQLVHKYNGILHVDAVQAFPYMRIDVKELGIDMMSVSGHKFRCPKGIGFLYKRKDIKLSPIIRGGNQENELRAGTENVPYIYAMGNRIQDMASESFYTTRLFGMKLWDIIHQVCSPLCEVRLNGSSETRNRLWHILSITFKGIDAQALITLLNDRGICVSSGSACSSGEKVPSRVLKAIGLNDEDAASTLRISVNDIISPDECKKFAKNLYNCLNILKITEGDDNV